MSAPVIYDDGGSTRIKKIMGPGAAGVMDALLDVNEGVPAANRAGSIQVVPAVGANYRNITISFIDSDGIGGRALGPMAFTTFEIRSGSQTIEGSLESGNLKMIVHGPSVSPPIIEARQHRGKRRYIVSNAPPIEEVLVDGISRYLAATPGSGSDAALYTSVTITS